MTDVHKIWSADEYAVEVTVTKSDDGLPLDLTGAVVQASAANLSGTVGADSVTVTDAAGGKFIALWGAGVLPSGLWTVEARVTPVSDGPQTVAQYALRVAKSQFTAA